MSNTVLAINMIRGFCEDGYPMFVGESVRGIIPNVRRLLERESKAGSHVIYVCDKHEPDDPAFQLTVRHCVAGTPEVDIISELAHIPGDVIYKVRKSAFFKTDLDERLKRLAPEKLIVCGVPSNNYVLHTVADARNSGLPRRGASRLRRCSQRRGARLCFEPYGEDTRCQREGNCGRLIVSSTGVPIPLCNEERE